MAIGNLITYFFLLSQLTKTHQLHLCTISVGKKSKLIYLGHTTEKTAGAGVFVSDNKYGVFVSCSLSLVAEVEGGGRGCGAMTGLILGKETKQKCQKTRSLLQGTNNHRVHVLPTWSKPGISSLSVSDYQMGIHVPRQR